MILEAGRKTTEDDKHTCATHHLCLLMKKAFRPGLFQGKKPYSMLHGFTKGYANELGLG